MTELQERICISVKQALAQGRFFTVSEMAVFNDNDRWLNFDAWAETISEECACDVSYNKQAHTFIFTAKEQMPIEDVSFRAGFEAAKNAAIICARQSEHYNLFEPRGCKAVQHSIEFMQRLDASRFNHDGTMKPETYVEYDREKHGPIVNGKVSLPIPPVALAQGAQREESARCSDCVTVSGRHFCTMNCGPCVERKQ